MLFLVYSRVLSQFGMYNQIIHLFEPVTTLFYPNDMILITTELIFSHLKSYMQKELVFLKM